MVDDGLVPAPSNAGIRIIDAAQTSWIERAARQGVEEYVMPIPWERPLSQRRPARQRLAGIDVFHDFVWREVFGHDIGAFRNGQSLSEMVRRDCPDGKRATLVLTTLPSAQPRIIETSDRYVAIVPIADYMSSGGPDAATTYYARASGTRVTRLSTLREAEFSAQELQQFLASHLTDAVLREWMSQSPARRQLLEQLAGSELASPTGSIDAAAALRSISEIDDATVRALVDVLRLQPLAAYARPLLDLLTASGEGRARTTLAFGARLPQRIADVRAQLVEYTTLVDTAGTTETDVQVFLERHPWIVGLNYVRARGRIEVPRGAIDFVLERFDGFFDIVELKSPGERIIVERGVAEDDERPGSPSRFMLSPALGQAVAQAHLYRAILSAAPELLRTQYGLSETRYPRILILIGRSTTLTDAARDVLRELNLSLHRVEIVPYDLLGARMTGLLSNIEALVVDSPT